MNVLVMGGTQFNGLALVHELARAGHTITILNRGKTEARLPSGITRLTCDRTDLAALKSTLAGRDWDCVYDISAYRPEDVATMVEVLEGHTGHYILASSTVIYAASDLLPISENHPVERGETQNSYGGNKLLCEDLLMQAWRERGFPMSIAAFSMVFGPYNIIPEREQRMFMRLKAGRRIMLPGDGQTVGQVGHVYDEARALRAMMQKTATFGRRYNLTGAVGTGVLGWPSKFRSQHPQPSQTLEASELVSPLEENGFSLLDFTPEGLEVRLFRWLPGQGEAAIDSLEPFAVLSFPRLSPGDSQVAFG